MRPVRLTVAAALALVLLPLTAAPALAAPPANDTPSGAVPLHLGDRVMQNTTEATTDAGDTADNQNCGAPETNASVWYSYTPASTGTFILDATRSSYSTGILVFEGTPSSDSLVACGPGTVGVQGRAGTTYTIMVISDTATNGGTMVLSLRKAPPPPQLRVRLARRGLAFRGGAARLHGTYFCSHGQGGAFLNGSLNQRAGRLKIPGEFSKHLRCNGVRHHWSARVVSRNGLYARGPARAKVTIFTCGMFSCRQASAKHRVRLVWAHHRAGRREQLRPTHASTAQRPTPLVARSTHWR